MRTDKYGKRVEQFFMITLKNYPEYVYAWHQCHLS
jgi:hypothetical protein